MSFSFIAMNRVVEEKAARDAAYRAELKRNGKVLLSEARKLSDDALLSKLAEFGIALDREGLRKLVDKFLSAEAIFREAIKGCRRPIARSKMGEDWVWFAFTLLWERWFPDIPSTEMFDERMQEGYRLQERDLAAACDCWLGVWRDFLTLLERSGVRSIAEFDEELRGTQFVANWVQDLDIALSNASVGRPEYHRQRMRWADEFLQRFGGHDSHMTELIRWALGEATWGSGERAQAESLFEAWLREDPQWGWGWIAWSDLHWFPRHNARPDHARAEGLLQRGLAVPGVRDREELITRLTDLYKKTGRSDEVAALAQHATKARTTATVAGENQLRLRTTFDFGAEGLPLEAMLQPSAEPRQRHFELLQTMSQRKVGRNEPCPCGSGKKFKHCCGR